MKQYLVIDENYDKIFEKFETREEAEKMINKLKKHSKKKLVVLEVVIAKPS